MEMERFTVSNGNKSFKSVDGVLYNYALSRLINYPNMKTAENYTVKSDVSVIEDYAFFSPTYLKALFFVSSTVPEIKSQGNCCSL